jgi:hypothetical protein
LGDGTETRVEGGATQLAPLDYEQLIGAVRETVHRVVPLNATVLVVSRGDDELLQLGPRRGLHFPQTDDGRYAGFHPADSDAAIAMVEKMRTKGAEYLLLPSTAFWWLDYYESLKRYIEHRYRVVEAGPDCWIAELAGDVSLRADTGGMRATSSSQQLVQPLQELIESLLPEDGGIAILAVGSRDPDGLDGYQTWLISHEASQDPDAVIASLDDLAANDVQFVVVPEPLFEWMAEYPGLSQRLADRYRLVTRQANLCEIFELQPRSGPAAEPATSVPAPAAATERNGIAPSFGERIRNVFIPSRRNGHSG